MDSANDNVTKRTSLAPIYHSLPSLKNFARLKKYFFAINRMSITPTVVNVDPDFPYAFSICTLVTQTEPYKQMLASFEQAGFGAGDCQFLMIDNRYHNQSDAYQGINRLLNAAQAPYVIICHQDILLNHDLRPQLERQLALLEQQDPCWAVAGNAGGANHLSHPLKIRISDPHGSNRYHGPLPSRVASLDENFMVIKKLARLGLSCDLRGFHFYGLDICLQAEHRGWHCYVVDFHLTHLSPGVRSEAFDHCKRQLIARYQQRWRPRWLRLPCSAIYLSASAWRNRWFNQKWVYKWVKRYCRWFHS